MMDNIETEICSENVQFENQNNSVIDDLGQLECQDPAMMAVDSLTSSSFDKAPDSDSKLNKKEIENVIPHESTLANIEPAKSTNESSTSDLKNDILPIRSCRRRSRTSVGYICPVCHASLRSKEELINHVDLELHRLTKPSRARRSETLCENSFMRKQLYQAFLRVKHSRQIRIQAHRTVGYSTAVRSRRVSSCRGEVDGASSSLQQQESVCPVCRLTISGSEQQLSRHVDHCLQFDGVNSDDEIEVDDDDDYEEYEWAGQTRIRATTMVHRAVAGSDLTVVREQSAEESLLRVNIDEDDTLYYGPTQFTEADLIRCSSDEPQNTALLEAVVGSSTAKSTGESSCNGRNEKSNDKKMKDDRFVQSERTKSTSSSNCHICMDPYLNPLTSIQCWHVHCQQCWLRALGVKKLCPQCNTITSPQDLRKIYL